MENITRWIAMASILYSRVLCSDYSNDFEVIHTSSSFGGLKLQSLHPQPLSPDNRRRTRNAFEPESDYVGSHNAFLWKFFDIAADYTKHESNDDDNDRHEKTNDKYQQAPSDVEQLDTEDRYDHAYNDYQYDRIRLAHKQNQESHQNPNNCKVVVKDGMECSICKNSAGSHSKLCSRSSTPEKQKYEYTKQRMAAYTSEDDYDNV